MTGLPENWEWSTVGEVAQLINGDRGKNYPSKSDFVPLGMPFVNAGHLCGGMIDFSDMNFITPERFERLGGTAFVAGDLLYCLRGSLGKMAVVRGTQTGKVASSLVVIRPAGPMPADLMYHWLSSPGGEAEIARYDNGSAQPNLASKSLARFRIPVPPRNEQDRIAEAIEQAFSRLEVGEAGLRLVRRLLGRTRASILAAAVTGRVASQYPTDNPAGTLLSTRLVGETIANAGLPEGWAAATIESVLAHTIGGVWGAEEGSDEIDVAVLRVTEMRPDGSLDPSTAVRRAITGRQLETRRLQVGDLLLEKSGGGPARPVGRVGLVREVSTPSVCANFMQLLRPQRSICNPEFLEIALRHLHSSGGTDPLQTASTNIRNLKMPAYFATHICLPPLEEQARIVDVVERQMSFIDACERSVAAGLKVSAALRRSVLKAAFEGRLVPQDPTDEPASVLLERIRAERAATPEPKKRRARATA